MTKHIQEHDDKLTEDAVLTLDKLLIIMCSFKAKTDKQHKKACNSVATPIIGENQRPKEADVTVEGSEPP
ncbi:unnamed protein product [Peronospora belbahrii]|uniref:Uncharacterized protein n=1 Tax=Peronospora belbahrii TaxID=622444 RepID=A0AAU9KND4_9STRA|nr:unnamed protein product [Peronospora belbahrii]